VTQRSIDQLNEKLAPHEKIRAWKALHGELTVDNGALTPTLKIRRKVIAATYASTIRALYQQAPGGSV
jgi:long-chain acyl-CoA synthetase